MALPKAQVPTISHIVNLLNFLNDSDDNCDVVPVRRARSSNKEKDMDRESSDEVKKKTKETNHEERPKKMH